MSNAKTVTVLKSVASLSIKPRQLKLHERNLGKSVDDTMFALRLLASNAEFKDKFLLDIWHHPTEMLSPSFTYLVSGVCQCSWECKVSAIQYAKSIKRKIKKKPSRYVLITPYKLMLSILVNLLSSGDKGRDYLEICKIIINYTFE